MLYLLGRTIPASVGLLALGLYTRLLSPDEYGLYALAVAGMSLLNAVFFQWLSLSVGRFMPAHENEPEVLLSTALRAFMVLLVLTGAFGMALALLWANDNLRGLFMVTVLVAWSQAWFDLNLQIANARLSPVRYGILSSVRALIALGAGLLFLYMGFGVTGILIGLITGLLASSALAWRYWRGCSLRGQGVSVFKDLIAYGAPLALTFTLVLLVDVSDRFILGMLMGAGAVGGYAAAYDLTQQSLGLLAGVVHLAAYPLAVRALEDNGVAEARKQLRDNGYLLLAISLPATVGLVLLADNISTVVLGAEFRETAGIIIAWVAVGMFVGTVKSYYLDYSFQLGRRMRSQVWTVGIAAMTNILLNLLWIPVYGVLGAAYATVGAFLAGFLVSWYLGRKAFPLPLPRQVYKPVLASFGMAIVLWPTLNWRNGPDLVIQIVMGACAYGLILMALNLDKMATGKLSTHFFRKIR